MAEKNVNHYSEAIAIGNYYMVEKLTDLEKDKTRKKKKENEKRNKTLPCLQRYVAIIR